MQKTLEWGRILQLKDLWLQQVDKTKHVCVERHVVSHTDFTEREISSTLQQGTQHRQLPANTLLYLFIYFKQKSQSAHISRISG